MLVPSRIDSVVTFCERIDETMYRMIDVVHGMVAVWVPLRWLQNRYFYFHNSY